MRYLVTLAFWTFFTFTTLLFFVIAVSIWLLTVWWDRRLALLHLFTCFWGYLYIWVMPPWDATIEDRHKLLKTPSVMVSNHQSGLDILVAFGLFSHFKWVSKAENFKVPFIGWNMKLNRYIPILRGDKDSIRKMMAACEKTLKNGSSVYLFAEGTRSPTGVVKPFKPGAFILAHSQKVPIQPLVFNGTKNALPKRSLMFHGYHRITLRVMDAIPYERFAELSVEETAEMVRQLIAAEVKENQDLATSEAAS